MPRLFVAIDLPDDIKQTLAALGHGLPGVRWLKPEHLHLTLRFIGEADAELFTAIREGLTGQDFAHFSCRLQGVGSFPPRGKPKVIWTGVDAEAALSRLQHEIEAGLRRLGVTPEERKFVPHITLARPKDTTHHALGQYLSAHHAFQTNPFTVQAFHLYSSLLTPQGAIHTRERSYPLCLDTTNRIDNQMES